MPRELSSLQAVDLLVRLFVFDTERYDFLSAAHSVGQFLRVILKDKSSGKTVLFDCNLRPFSQATQYMLAQIDERPDVDQFVFLYDVESPFRSELDESKVLSNFPGMMVFKREGNGIKAECYSHEKSSSNSIPDMMEQVRDSGRFESFRFKMKRMGDATAATQQKQTPLEVLIANLRPFFSAGLIEKYISNEAAITAVSQYYPDKRAKETYNTLSKADTSLGVDRFLLFSNEKLFDCLTAILTIAGFRVLHEQLDSGLGSYYQKPIVFINPISFKPILIIPEPSDPEEPGIKKIRTQYNIDKVIHVNFKQNFLEALETLLSELGVKISNTEALLFSLFKPDPLQADTARVIYRHESEILTLQSVYDPDCFVRNCIQTLRVERSDIKGFLPNCMEYKGQLSSLKSSIASAKSSDAGARQLYITLREMVFKGIHFNFYEAFKKALKEDEALAPLFNEEDNTLKKSDELKDTDLQTLRESDFFNNIITLIENYFDKQIPPFKKRLEKLDRWLPHVKEKATENTYDTLQQIPDETIRNEIIAEVKQYEQRKIQKILNRHAEMGLFELYPPSGGAASAESLTKYNPVSAKNIQHESYHPNPDSPDKHHAPDSEEATKLKTLVTLVRKPQEDLQAAFIGYLRLAGFQVRPKETPPTLTKKTGVFSVATVRSQSFDSISELQKAAKKTLPTAGHFYAFIGNTDTVLSFIIEIDITKKTIRVFCSEHDKSAEIIANLKEHLPDDWKAFTITKEPIIFERQFTFSQAITCNFKTLFPVEQPDPAKLMRLLPLPEAASAAGEQLLSQLQRHLDDSGFVLSKTKPGQYKRGTAPNRTNIFLSSFDSLEEYFAFAKKEPSIFSNNHFCCGIITDGGTNAPYLVIHSGAQFNLFFSVFDQDKSDKIVTDFKKQKKDIARNKKVSTTFLETNMAHPSNTIAMTFERLPIIGAHKPFPAAAYPDQSLITSLANQGYSVLGQENTQRTFPDDPFQTSTGSSKQETAAFKKANTLIKNCFQAGMIQIGTFSDENGPYGYLFSSPLYHETILILKPTEMDQAHLNALQEKLQPQISDTGIDTRTLKIATFALTTNQSIAFYCTHTGDSTVCKATGDATTSANTYLGVLSIKDSTTLISIQKPSNVKERSTALKLDLSPKKPTKIDTATSGGLQQQVSPTKPRPTFTRKNSTSGFSGIPSLFSPTRKKPAASAAPGGPKKSLST